MKQYMQYQCETITKEYGFLSRLCSVKEKKLPNFENFVLVWISIRAKEFRDWYQCNNKLKQNFEEKPQLFSKNNL